MIDKYLSTFIAVSKFKSFTKASKFLKITQAGVSRQIKALENSIGRQLIVRNPRSVILTKDGEELFHRGEDFLKWYQDSFLKNNIQTIRIGTYQVFGEYWLSHFLKKEIVASNLDCHFDLKLETHKYLQSSLLSGKLDLIITRELISRSDVSSFKLLEEQIFLVSKKIHQINKISELNWVVYSDNDFLLLNYPRTSGKIIKVNSYKAMFEFLELENFIACAPSFVIEEYGIKKFKMLKKLSNLSGPLYVSTLNFQKPSLVLGKLLKMLRALGK